MDLGDYSFRAHVGCGWRRGILLDEGEVHIVCTLYVQKRAVRFSWLLSRNNLITVAENKRTEKETEKETKPRIPL